MKGNKQHLKISFIDRVRNTPKRLRRIFALVCAVVLLGTSIPIVSLSAQGAQEPVYAKTTDSLNLRKGAGTKYGVIDVIDKNVIVTVVGRTSSSWLKVKLSDGTTGYCSGDYLDIITDARVTESLNLRKGAGTGYQVIKTLLPGEVGYN